MTVTAQDFIKAIRIIVNRHDSNEYASLDSQLTEQGFDALLSQVRQEARAEGRREGLKEMDEAYQDAYEWFEGQIPAGQEKLEKLRQEYQQP